MNYLRMTLWKMLNLYRPLMPIKVDHCVPTNSHALCIFCEPYSFKYIVLSRVKQVGAQQATLIVLITSISIRTTVYQILKPSSLPPGRCTHAHAARLNTVFGLQDISTPPTTNCVFDDPGDNGQTPENVSKQSSIPRNVSRITIRHNTVSSITVFCFG